MSATEFIGRRDRRTPLFAIVLLAATALLLSVFIAPPAHAEETDEAAMFFSDEELEAIVPGGSDVLDPYVFHQGLVELEGSEIPRETITEGERTFYRYAVEGTGLTFPSATDIAADIADAEAAGEEPDPGMITPYLEVLINGIHTAIGLNITDQQALAAGGGAALAVAICLIPVVGQIACVIVSVAVAVLTAYLVANGICTGGRTLWFYDVPGGSTVECRSTTPPGF